MDTPPTAPRARLARQVIGPFTMRHLAALGGSLVTAAIILILVTTPLASPSATPLPRPGNDFYRLGDDIAGFAVGQMAPELAGTIDGRAVELLDLDGHPVRLSDLRGRPVWVNFWATWCPPCQEETPVLRDVFERHRGEMALVAVSVQETSPQDVRAYASTYGLGYTIGFDASSAVFHAWHGFGLPTHYFLDRDGVIRQLHYGPLSAAQVETILEPLLDD